MILHITNHPYSRDWKRWSSWKKQCHRIRGKECRSQCQYRVFPKWELAVWHWQKHWVTNQSCMKRESVVSEHRAGKSKPKVNIPQFHWLKEQPQICHNHIFSSASGEKRFRRKSVALGKVNSITFWGWSTTAIDVQERVTEPSVVIIEREHEREREAAVTGNPESRWLLICSICHGIMWTNCDIQSPKMPSSQRLLFTVVYMTIISGSGAIAFECTEISTLLLKCCFLWMWETSGSLATVGK